MNWKPNATDADKKTLLTGDYAPHAPHAPDIAQAIRHVMTSVKPASQPPQPASGKIAAAVRLQGRAPDFADMVQRPVTIPVDRAPLLRTLAGVDRHPPVNVDAFRRSLHAAAPGALGFVIAFKGPSSDFRYQILTTPGQVTAERGIPTAPRQRIHAQALFSFGDFFTHAWDHIKSAAEKAADAIETAAKLVITISNQIDVAIHTLENGVMQITHIVIDSVKKAIEIVTAFIKAILLAIWLLILFLRAICDWPGIRGATRLIKRMLFSVADMISSDAVLTPIRDTVTDVANRIDEFLGLDPTKIAGSPAASIQGTGGDDDGALSWATCVIAMLPFHRTLDYIGEATVAGFSDPSSESAEIELVMTQFLNATIDLGKDVMRLDFSTLASSVVNLLRTVGADVINGMRDWTIAIVDGFAKSMPELLTLMDEMDIPFISALFEWIFDEKLTLLNLFCFIAGFPLHIAYYMVTEGSRISDDGDGLLRSNAAATPAAAVRSLAEGSSRSTFF